TTEGLGESAGPGPVASAPTAPNTPLVAGKAPVGPSRPLRVGGTPALGTPVARGELRSSGTIDVGREPRREAAAGGPSVVVDSRGTAGARPTTRPPVAGSPAAAAQKAQAVGVVEVRQTRE